MWPSATSAFHSLVLVVLTGVVVNETSLATTPVTTTDWLEEGGGEGDARGRDRGVIAGHREELDEALSRTVAVIP